MVKMISELSTDSVGEEVELYLPAALCVFDKLGVTSGFDAKGQVIKMTVEFESSRVRSLLGVVVCMCGLWFFIVMLHGILDIR
jgi:hypothetical protein